MKTKRIAWLYNHSTLIKSEVPMLIELGYEVYVPKKPPFDVSIAVDWSLDNQLTMSQDEIDILNKIDFYDQKIPREAMDIMNKNFDAVIFGIFIEPLKSLVMGFHGILIFHPFGLENGTSYTDIIELRAGVWLLKEIEKLGNRFWFGQSYDNLMEIECDFFKKRAISLPIGMKDISISDRWTGNAQKMLFICPRIKINSYYEKIYREFKKEFADIPHSIGGAQPIDVENDNTVIGFLNQKDYENLYPSHSVMFYHSQEERHVHYHPFEAIKCGLPLVYMAGGLLDKLGGENLPGRCKSIKEAKSKCKRIIKGDIKLADKLRNTQAILLEKMSYEYCMEVWKKSMSIIENISKNTDLRYSRTKKLGILLPAEYTGGVLDYTVRFIYALKKGIELHNDNIEIIFGYLDHANYDEYDYFKKLKDLNITMRKFKWESISFKRVEESLKILGYSTPFYNETYSVPNDNIRHFEDCDFILFMADRVPEKLYINQPYGVVIHDYIQRYLPSHLGNIYEKPVIELVRGAEVVLTTTETTKMDCVQYAGVRENKIMIVPLFFDTISKVKNGYIEKKIDNYFIWSTNISKHKNHKIALRALSEYYANGGNMKCCVTGVHTDLFDLKNKETHNDYVNQIRDIIRNDKLLRKNIIFYGNLPKNNYIFLLQNAEFLLHAGFGDNGNGTAFDAAMLGVPTISSDYPAMRNIESVLKIGIRFFNKNDSEDLKNLLIDAQNNCKVYKSKLPSFDELKKFTVQNFDLCNQIYEITKNNTYL